MSDRRSSARVLLRAPNWLGDAVMALPAMSALRGAFPDSHLTVAAPASVVVNPDVGPTVMPQDVAARIVSNSVALVAQPSGLPLRARTKGRPKGLRYLGSRA